MGMAGQSPAKHGAAWLARKACLVMVRPVRARQASLGWSRRGAVWPARHGQPGLGMARNGMAVVARTGLARRGEAAAGHGGARQGRQGEFGYGWAGQGGARPARQVYASARCGWSCRGQAPLAGLGMDGLSWRGEPWLGRLAWLGAARQAPLASMMRQTMAEYERRLAA